MRIAFKHIEAGAGGAEQHDVAGFGQAVGGLHGFLQAGAIQHLHAAAGQVAADLRCVFADEQHSAGFAGQHVFQRGEVLPFALPAGNQEQRALQAGDGGFGGAHIGAFAVVDKHHAVFLADFFHAVRQAFEGAHMVQQLLARQADGFAQSQRGQYVGGVVQALQRNVGGGNQRFRAVFQVA